MKKMAKVIAGGACISAAGLMTYLIMNKKVRRKAMELKDVMIDEAKDSLKKS